MSVNSTRSNKVFGNVTSGTAVAEAPGSFYNTTTWEPTDSIKGDIARIVFYMATRYEGEDSNGDLELERVGDVCTFLEWNANDPISEEEIERNNKVYEYQNNRNPFIDHNEWVQSIWGESCN